MGLLRVGGIRQPSHQRFTVSHISDVGAIRRAVSGYVTGCEQARGLRTGPGWQRPS